MRWKVNLSNGYMSIVNGDTKELARIAAKSSLRGRFGEPAKYYDPEIVAITPATDEDISWYVGMGGYLPE